jgi:hypothetical protein
VPVELVVKDSWKYPEEIGTVTNFLLERWAAHKQKIDDLVVITLQPIKNWTWKYRIITPDKYQKKGRKFEVICYLGYKEYPVTYRELHKIGTVDRFTHRLSGKLFIKQREEIVVRDMREDAVMLFSRASWGWLREFKCEPGRTGKCGANRYAAEMLEKWRKLQEDPATCS